jgi:hypothetical protein
METARQIRARNTEYGRQTSLQYRGSVTPYSLVHTSAARSTPLVLLGCLRLYQVLQKSLLCTRHSRDISVGIPTGYGLDGRSSILGRICLVSTASRPTRAPIRRLRRVLQQEAGRPGSEADHSPISNSEVKYDGDIP